MLLAALRSRRRWKNPGLGAFCCAAATVGFCSRLLRRCALGRAALDDDDEDDDDDDIKNKSRSNREYDFAESEPIDGVDEWRVRRPRDAANVRERLRDGLCVELDGICRGAV